MSIFDINETPVDHLSDEQRADAKYIITVMGRYEDDAEHNLALACRLSVLAKREADDEIDSYTLFSSVGQEHGVSTTRAVQYYNYADMFTKWEQV